MIYTHIDVALGRACTSLAYTGNIPQWAAGGFEEFLNIMNFYVFLIVWDNRVNKL